MPLGPEHLKKVNIEAIYRVIDDSISSSSVLPVKVDLRLLPGFRIIKDKVISSYLRIGWKNVEVIYDQRDGDYLQLS